MSQSSDGVHCVQNQYPQGWRNQRPYTSVLDSTQTLLQVGEVGQEFQQRADSFGFAVVVYLLNGVETLVNIPKLGERIPKQPQ